MKVANFYYCESLECIKNFGGVLCLFGTVHVPFDKIDLKHFLSCVEQFSMFLLNMNGIFHDNVYHRRYTARQIGGHADIDAKFVADNDVTDILTLWRILRTFGLDISNLRTKRM